MHIEALHNPGDARLIYIIREIVIIYLDRVLNDKGKLDPSLLPPSHGIGLRRLEEGLCLGILDHIFVDVPAPSHVIFPNKQVVLP